MMANNEGVPGKGSRSESESELETKPVVKKRYFEDFEAAFDFHMEHPGSKYTDLADMRMKNGDHRVYEVNGVQYSGTGFIVEYTE